MKYYNVLYEEGVAQLPSLEHIEESSETHEEEPEDLGGELEAAPLPLATTQGVQSFRVAVSSDGSHLSSEVVQQAPSPPPLAATQGVRSFRVAVSSDGSHLNSSESVQQAPSPPPLAATQGVRSFRVPVSSDGSNRSSIDMSHASGSGQ